MKSAMPQFFMNDKSVRLVAIIPVKDSTEGCRIAGAIRRESPHAKVKHTTKRGWVVIAHKPQAEELPTNARIGFQVSENLLGPDGNPRKDIVFHMNVAERGGRRMTHGSKNFATVICNKDGEKLAPLSIRYEMDEPTPVAIFANHNLIAVVANDEGYISINSLSMKHDRDVVYIEKVELFAGIHYKDENFPLVFYEAAEAAVERARCKGCAKPHFCQLFRRPERNFPEAARRKFNGSKEKSS